MHYSGMALFTRIIRHIKPECSLTNWPIASNQKPENLSGAGFFHAGKIPYNFKKWFITNNYYFLNNKLI